MKSKTLGQPKVNHRVRYKPIEVDDIFDRLTVIAFIERRRESGTWQLYWQCQCSCGETVTVRDANLKNHTTRSCGSLQREAAARTDWKVTHGEGSNGKESPEYNGWRGMFRRVDNGREKEQRSYADRGVRICQGLRDSYVFFLSIIGRKPTSKHTLDRANNNGHYSCGQCEECVKRQWDTNIRWATMKEQANNRRHRNQYTGPAPIERITI